MYIYIYITNGLGDLSSISGQVISKTPKIVLNAFLLSIIRYRSRANRSRVNSSRANRSIQGKV